ncbi:hypothetical protein EV651_11233 [Kribbella sp. VKM Ac-2571]|uniref:hypothetical protein n=1 Tax=Kribbella sp. VKM Ac-2571 TaxID=2512222 RepID=UPI001062213E|nr:hypothetical protein [Kribbella sp. VKM Ac-2571]TDO56646.1 hypothetical protein EV651_11233 [Kribbella sp. VKM Ac-2571]
MAPDGLVDAIARSGDAFLTATVHEGRPAVRAAFSNWRTRHEDVDRLLPVVAGLVRQAPD